MQPVKKVLNLVFALASLLAVLGAVSIILSPLPFLNVGWAILITAASMLTALFTSLVLRPVRYRSPAPLPEETYPQRRHEADVLVVVSIEEIRDAAGRADFHSKDWSYEWLNIVETAVGPYSVLDMAQVTDADLEQTRVIVLTRSASRGLSAEWSSRLMTFMQEGGVVISEGPSPLVGSALGAASVTPRVGRVHLDTMSSEFIGDSGDREALAGRPLHTVSYLLNIGTLSLAASGGVEVLASSSGRPCIVRSHQGKGRLIAILFDLSTALVALKQGIPGRGLVARILSNLMYGWGWPKPAHSIPKLRHFAGNAPVPPLLEILSDAIFRLARSRCPMPVVSRLPSGKRAFLIMTHDEDYDSSDLASVIRDEAAAGVPQTVFLLADAERDPGDKTTIEQSASEVALHTNRFRVHFDRSGVHANQYRSPVECLASLTGEFPAHRITSNRIHWLSWDRRLGETFRRIASAGITIDSSQGPVSQAKGYIFATGFGYRPLDDNGAPLALVEIPYQIEDDLAGADASYLGDIIERCSEQWRTGVVLLLHPWGCVGAGRLRPFFEGVLSLAARERVWAATLSELVGFRRARRECEVRSQFESDTLTVSLRAQAAGLELEVPSAARGLRVQEVLIDGVRVSGADSGRGAMGLSVPAGAHTLSVRYGTEAS